MDDSYADLAPDYEWLFPDEAIGGSGTVAATSPGSKDLVEAILQTLPPGARVLDSACGIGADAMALARRGFNVTASDGSPSMVAEARRRCTQFGVDDFSAPCRAEIVLLFEDASSAIAHRRYVIDFTPFTRAALTDAIHAVGLTVIGDSYQPDNPFYAVAAAMR